MSRRNAGLVCAGLVAAITVSGCSWFSRDKVQPTESPTSSTTTSGSPTESASTQTPSRQLSEVLSRTQSAGGASVQVSVELTGVNTSSFSGLLDVWTGEGRGDYTSASGRVAQRIIKGGKTYTSAGTSWVATSQSGRGLVGGDLPTLWQTVRAAALTSATSNSYQGAIDVRTALQLAGIDANTIALLNLSGAVAALTLNYDADGLVQSIKISADMPSASKTLKVAVAVSDFGQIVDVIAPSVAITSGPEGQ